MPSLEISVSRVSVLVTVGRKRNPDVIERPGTVGDGASALDFTTIADFFLPLAGVCRQDTGRSHLCMFVGYRQFHSFGDELPTEINVGGGIYRLFLRQLRDGNGFQTLGTALERRSANNLCAPGERAESNFPTPSAYRLEKKREELDYEFHASRLSLWLCFN